MNPIKTFLLPAKGSPLLQNLMQQSLWRQGDEDDQWAQRAVEHLIKKIKKNKGALEALEQAIINRDEHTPCVTIQRSLDGRLQISHRKGLPHVIYCRVWRWPDLQSHHELRPVKQCRHPFIAIQQRQHSTQSAAAENNNGSSSPSLPDVCINPYHYERVESPVLPPVLVPRRSEFAPFMSFLPAMGSPQQQQQQPSHSYSYPELLQHHHVAGSSTAYNQQIYNSPQQQLRYSQTYSPLPIPSSSSTNLIAAGSPGVASSHASEFSDLGSPPQCSFDRTRITSNGNHTTVFSNHQEDDDMMDDEIVNGNSSTSPNKLPRHIHLCLHGSPAAPPEATSARTRAATISDDVVPVDYEEAENWCVIAYYEFNNRVGELFHARQIHVVVDGFTVPTRAATRTKSSTFEMSCSSSTRHHPPIKSGRQSLSNGHSSISQHRTSVSSSASGDGECTEDLVESIDRFSLGTLPNVARSAQVEQCRQAIGKGVHLYYVGGEVYAEVLSNSSMFVQSRLSNMKNKFHAMTVCKIPPGCSIKIFSNQYFASLLHEKACESYEAVYELNKLCTIRMSLVKGWGADYSRNDVTATPCWIEIRLNGPLGWLDRVLSHMPPPPNLISSRS